MIRAAAVLLFVAAAGFGYWWVMRDLAPRPTPATTEVLANPELPNPAQTAKNFAAQQIEHATGEVCLANCLGEQRRCLSIHIDGPSAECDSDKARCETECDREVARRTAHVQ